MSDGSTRLFVYGSLMPGGTRWSALEPFATGWERATARGRLWDTGRGYPAIRFDGDGGFVPGFVVTIDAGRSAEAIAVLDAVEQEGVLYRRVVVATSVGPAASYEWRGSTAGLTALPGGWPGAAPAAP